MSLIGQLLQTFSRHTKVVPVSLNGLKSTAIAKCQLAPSRSYYTDWKMIRDVKRRAMVKEYAPLRLRLNCIRKNRILPKEIQEIADQEIGALPRDSARHRVRNRCVITSRPRYVFRHWHLSRIMFRHLADYNYLSGAQRAMW